MGSRDLQSGILLYILYCNITQPVFTIELSSLNLTEPKKALDFKNRKKIRAVFHQKRALLFRSR